ncbi:hypothetical protein AB0K16_22260 [Nonomuraea jabiensis]|uniref:hypothetical protein n=1 Tax=Nonomuraea jabiensis TaxID=882448 RepID=UPI003449BCD5
MSETDAKRVILEVFDEGLHPHAWHDWKRNYINVQHDMHNDRLNEKFAEHFKDVVIYVREPDGTNLLSPPLKINDITLAVRHPKQPGDIRRIAFSYIDGPMYRHEEFGSLYFDYSPSGGYAVPPEHILDAGPHMTRDALWEYSKYYIDGPGYMDLRSAEFSTPVGKLRLHQLEVGYRGLGNLRTLWGISRGERDSREVWGVSEQWIPEGSRKEEISLGFVNQYPEWGWKWEQAIKWLDHFAQADSKGEDK